MNDVTVIDRFLATFSRYIDSGFGLLQGEVAFLTATLIVIDMTIAGLYWAMSHATDQGDDVIAKLLRKVLYVGAFAYIINNFNWLASTKAMCEWLSCIRGVVPIIIDNNSSYEPLLDWYATDCDYELIRLTENSGHHAPWNQSCITWGHTHRARFGSNYYAVTDPDLNFTGVPWDLFDQLQKGFHVLPQAIKIGIGLRIDDIPEHSRERVHRCEGSYWTRPATAEFWHAPVDTTLALYRASTNHSLAMDLGVPTLRTNAPYVARHLPWYWRKEELNDEQRYYFAHCNSSNSWKPS